MVVLNGMKEGLIVGFLQNVQIWREKSELQYMVCLIEEIMVWFVIPKSSVKDLKIKK